MTRIYRENSLDSMTSEVTEKVTFIVTGRFQKLHERIERGSGGSERIREWPQKGAKGAKGEVLFYLRPLRLFAAIVFSWGYSYPVFSARSA